MVICTVHKWTSICRIGHDILTEIEKKNKAHIELSKYNLEVEKSSMKSKAKSQRSCLFKGY